MKQIILDVSEDCEGTAEPYWLILDPRQMLRLDIHFLAGMITGPIFSREEAQQHLDARRYAFGKNAAVFCHSGYWSAQYKRAWREASLREDK
jgi:hypothetical protein